ncbi:unnamed protein product [Pocillopora meandrina]|uniref:Uncharacterized protein n=1 Tax=Pocillopora meandrina TaxID=46732 RepID=A0AAU9WGQ4_9CNID|nr:unnamed protein product [Pocillopora meandrina]
MTVTSAYIGVLVLAYCTFQPVSSACSDCPCCLTTYKQCMDICEDPNQCTTVCVTNKEKCEEQYCNLTKRNPEGWRLKANGDSVSIPDLNSDIPREICVTKRCNKMVEMLIIVLRTSITVTAIRGNGEGQGNFSNDGKKRILVFVLFFVPYRIVFAC